MPELLGLGAFGAAVAFGFRHGFDWDHLAALTDLTGSQVDSRRSMRLATLYALGHAVMILLLGALAIVFAAKVPDGLDVVMERVAGVTLVALGVWIVWTAVQTRAAPPVRSRWMLAITAGRRLLRRTPAEPELVVIEHSHPHDHADPIHEHEHLDLGLPLADGATGEPAGAEVDGGAGAAPAAHRHDHAPVGTARVHAHTHRHVGLAPADPFTTYDSWSAFGIGLLHGIGAETPTQVLLFTAAAHASGTSSSLALLLCFVVGLVASNTVVAAASTLGFRSVLRNRWAMAVLAAVTAITSIAVGLFFLFGKAGSLPPLVH